MGTTRSIYEAKHTDDIYDLLVSGYLRHVSHNDCDDDTKKITSRAYKVRLKVFKLCIDFYHKKRNENLIIWSGTQSNGNAKCNAVSLIKLANYGLNNKKQHEVHKLNIHNLDDHNFCNVEWNVNFDRNASSFCLLSNIDVSQMKWLKNKSTPFKQNMYDMIFRIGAKDHNKSRADALIFDPYSTTNDMHLIEAYYSSEIATFPRMPFISNTNIIQHNHFIFGYGGTLNGNIWNNIYSLDVNNLKYRRYAQLSQAKYGVSLTINNNDLFILGGNDKNCHVLNIESNELTQISELNMKRLYCGSTYLHHDGTILVGGGCDDSDASNYSLEIYDSQQNKWNVMQCKTNKKHAKYPLIWNDKINGNIVYIAGDKTRNDLVKHLGFIEWCDIRENKKKFNVLFNNEPINHLFGLTKKRNTDKVNWISRAILV